MTAGDARTYPFEENLVPAIISSYRRPQAVGRMAADGIGRTACKENFNQQMSEVRGSIRLTDDHNHTIRKYESLSEVSYQ